MVTAFRSLTRRSTTIVGRSIPNTTYPYLNGERTNPANLGLESSGSDSHSTQDGDSSAVPEFVSVDGKQLTLDGNRFKVRGTNSFWLSYQYYDSGVVDEVLQEASKMGLNTLRVWGFGSGEPALFQPKPGVYNEEAFERLDYVVQRAAEYGIRLIIPLTNYWPDFGGMDQYVEWSDSASKRTDFYTDETCRELYKQYAETILTRTNTLTDTEYRNDPTIAVWELANEPRNPDASTGDGTVLHGWAHDMAAHLKSIDPNHLVSTGVEGFVFCNGSRYGDAGYWMNSQGYDFIGIHDSADVDIATFHLYPDHWDISLSDTTQFIKDRAREATEELGKPVYAGEFGKQVDRDASNIDEQLTTRNQCYEKWYDTMVATDVDGAAFWQLVADKLLDQGDDFSIVSPDDETTISVIESGTQKL